ncbi:cannabinoid receptor 1 [Lethenteron reissneri]|uniref:cannabinoid receptor 1 n=1 Tax=Lethenteron reissneri TaxID=7753 RepID=UPI002AB796CA|nr:cannabinoid receptor 1 [Lethenteron reissneri]XP_061423830.1 cannabinoid receptor 1 [Lethenteron reissneri]
MEPLRGNPGQPRINIITRQQTERPPVDTPWDPNSTSGLDGATTLGPLEENLNCSGNFLDMECFMILTRDQQTAIGVLSLTMGIFTVLENALVLFIIFRTRSLRRKPSYLFLGSVAFSDLLSSIVFVYSFTDFHVFHRKDTQNVFLFKLGGVTASFTASVCSLFLTAIDRYISIHQPLSYRTIVTRVRAVTALSVMWTIALLTGALPLMGWNCRQLHSKCSDIFPHIDKMYLLSFISLVTFLLVVIIYAYGFILWKAHRHTTNMIRRASTKMSRVSVTERRKVEQHRMDIRLAKTLVLILVALIICWGPVLTMMVYDVFGSVDNHMKRVFAFCSMLCLMNATINPVIYAMRSKDLRMACAVTFRPPRSVTQPLENSQESDGQAKSALATGQTPVPAAPAAAAAPAAVTVVDKASEATENVCVPSTSGLACQPKTAQIVLETGERVPPQAV